MIQNNQFLYSLKIVGEIFKNILFFPFWWYTRGLFSFIEREISFLNSQQKSLALMVWVKNIHKPMFGQTDWQGRFISFFMRLFQIIIRGMVMVFWILFTFTLIATWTILPVFVGYEIIFQLGLI